MSDSDNSDMRPEYDLNELGHPVRGKYAERYRQGTNLVMIDADLVTQFPDSDSVNHALREYLRISKSS